VNYAEVRWCDFPEPDHRRPAVIMTRARAIPDLTWITVAPISTRVRRSPAFVALSLDDGLFADCAVNCDRLVTLPKSAIGSFITTLSEEKLQTVRAAIRYALSLDPSLGN
jgi:mRNA-degrading endonuclease toxin of MazEF toxin-antitoxin module